MAGHALDRLSALTGIFFLGPQSKKLATLMADRPASDPEVQAGIRRLLLVARLDVALLLLAVFDMAAKPFS